MDNNVARGLKEDFPILKSCTYLDSAATTQKPRQVIDAMSRFYSSQYANIHRGVYKLSQEATMLYEDAHTEVADFIGSEQDEVIFTRNTTESINLLSYTLHEILPKRKEIVLTELEHHSNLVPWQQFAKRHGMKLRFIPLKKNFTLDYGAAEKLISRNTALIAVNHVSNVFGTINDVERLVSLAASKGALSVVDGAQAVPHKRVDVKKLGCDFYAFSGHKMLGPTGIGVLYGKRELLGKMPPFLTGGDMIRSVSFDSAEWNDLPMKFEAGTPHIAGAVGLAEAIRYLQKIGRDEILSWERTLLKAALKQLKGRKGVFIYSPGTEKSSGILSFNLQGVHSHDVASILDERGVCIRAGHHCAMPLMSKLGITGTSRASFYLYNTLEDVKRLVSGIEHAQEVFA